MHIPSFAAADAALEAFSPRNLHRVAYTTEYVQQFLASISNPQDAQPAIHIAGTSGKTSTAYYAAALLQAAGKKVGLLTSPHIHSLGERVQVDLQPMPEPQFCAELEIFMALVARNEVILTYAELLYAFAFWEFARQRVEYIVVEVGMGGLLDATNVISRSDKICIITDIGLDHVKALGGSLQEITRHKAGIIGLENTVFTYRQGPAVMSELQQAARHRQADLHAIEPPATPLPGQEALPLFQQRNSYLALQAVQWLLQRDAGTSLPAARIATALRVSIPGRMQVLQVAGKTIILDGAHNTQKLQALTASLRLTYPGQPIAAAVAFIASDSRNAAALLQGVQAFAGHILLVADPITDSFHRFRDVHELQELQTSDVELLTGLVPALDALLARPEQILVVTGSLYILDAAERYLTAFARS